ncbi:haloacid dehalogenase type II [Dechloromonas sp. A34]|uniref:haloacid dehalogenase type II n=1 Tax=Dechloromonas sp. A34 TaxID=447588 RepID=UPI00224949B8|nr:haloacid dehalogenase type II [Dechloromonas sp. A34]
MTQAPAAPIKAIAFDAYATLFDVYCMEALAEEYFPGQGKALTILWRQKQIEYTRIRSMSSQFRTFWEVTRDALIFAARSLQLAMTDSQRQHLMNQYACLRPFPENLATLEALKAMGIPLAILSNGTHSMLDIAVKYNDMNHLFAHILSADSVQKFKTSPEVYQLALDAFQLPARDILFVSANAWDACAATWFGFTTFWVNRSQQPEEVLDVSPTATGRQLSDVLTYVRGLHG